MAELVDALDSKSSVRKDVQVRFLFWAQTPRHASVGAFLIYGDSSLLEKANKYKRPAIPQRGIVEALGTPLVEVKEDVLSKAKNGSPE